MAGYRWDEDGRRLEWRESLNGARAKHKRAPGREIRWMSSKVLSAATLTNRKQFLNFLPRYETYGKVRNSRDILFHRHLDIYPTALCRCPNHIAVCSATFYTIFGHHYHIYMEQEMYPTVRRSIEYFGILIRGLLWMISLPRSTLDIMLRIIPAALPSDTVKHEVILKFKGETPE